MCAGHMCAMHCVHAYHVLVCVYLCCVCAYVRVCAAHVCSPVCLLEPLASWLQTKLGPKYISTSCSVDPVLPCEVTDLGHLSGWSRLS